MTLGSVWHCLSPAVGAVKTPHFLDQQRGENQHLAAFRGKAEAFASVFKAPVIWLRSRLCAQLTQRPPSCQLTPRSPRATCAATSVPFTCSSLCVASHSLLKHPPQRGPFPVSSDPSTLCPQQNLPPCSAVIFPKHLSLLMYQSRICTLSVFFLELQLRGQGFPPSLLPPSLPSSLPPPSPAPRILRGSGLST